jgi:phage shock protein E
MKIIEQLKTILGVGSRVNFRELVKNGAQIIDVRTNEEFRGNHVPGSVNIPLQNLEANLSRIRKDRPIITCCASGMRSASAKNILKANGFTVVYNGGSWISLQNKLS